MPSYFLRVFFEFILDNEKDVFLILKAIFKVKVTSNMDLTIEKKIKITFKVILCLKRFLGVPL